VNRSSSSSGYIEWLASNGNWVIQPLGGAPAPVVSGRTVTIGTWYAIIGRHNRGQSHGSRTLYYVAFNQTANADLLQPGDVLICMRIVGTNNIQFGNGLILNPDISFVNGSVMQSIPSVRNLQNELNNKAAFSHMHSIGNISQLQETLDSKSPTNHTHTTINITDIDTWFESMFQKSLLRIYPVGAYYISHVNTNPSTLFGGTWLQITERFLYCANAGGATGGSSTITIANLPAHNHGAKGLMVSEDGLHNHGQTWRGSTLPGLALRGTQIGQEFTGEVYSPYLTTSNGIHKHTISGAVADTGDGAAYMPPYITVYCWRRTA
jgi:hypothetical protein